jgi:hypothetical protein
VNLTSDLVAPCLADDLFPWVDDLGRYPQWMPLVHRAVPDDDSAGVWMVDLRARIGPLARSKRLRMTRTVLEHPFRVRFERAELDERHHAPWMLGAELVPAQDTLSTRLTVSLHYGGTLWTGGLLERVLSDQIDEGKRNLLALLSAPTR